MTCRKCGRKFILDPKKDDLTDGKFFSICHRLSRAGTLRFSRQQIMQEVYREYLRRGHVDLGFLFVFFVIFFSIIAGGPMDLPLLMAFAVGGCAGLVMVGFLHGKNRLKVVYKSQSVVTKWMKKGEVPGLIDIGALAEPPAEWSESDIYDYGVERIVVVNRDELVDFFVQNDFHQTSRSLIISANGYPNYLVPVAQKMVNDNSDLPIVLLHDYKGSNLTEEMKKKLSA